MPLNSKSRARFLKKENNCLGFLTLQSLHNSVFQVVDSLKLFWTNLSVAAITNLKGEFFFPLTSLATVTSEQPFTDPLSRAQPNHQTHFYHEQYSVGPLTGYCQSLDLGFPSSLLFPHYFFPQRIFTLLYGGLSISHSPAQL